MDENSLNLDSAFYGFNPTIALQNMSHFDEIEKLKEEEILIPGNNLIEPSYLAQMTETFKQHLENNAKDLEKSIEEIDSDYVDNLTHCNVLEQYNENILEQEEEIRNSSILLQDKTAKMLNQIEDQFKESQRTTNPEETIFEEVKIPVDTQGGMVGDSSGVLKMSEFSSSFISEDGDNDKFDLASESISIFNKEVSHITPDIHATTSLEEKIALLIQENENLKKLNENKKSKKLNDFLMMFNYGDANDQESKILFIIRHARDHNRELEIKDFECCNSDLINSIYNKIKEENKSSKTRIIIKYSIEIILSVIGFGLAKLGFEKVSKVIKNLDFASLYPNIEDECNRLNDKMVSTLNLDKHGNSIFMIIFNIILTIGNVVAVDYFKNG
ncbi:viral membrane formation protein [Carp edema virus]|nr:viral membrane formation protein [Carp edema virus]